MSKLKEGEKNFSLRDARVEFRVKRQGHQDGPWDRVPEETGEEVPETTRDTERRTRVALTKAGVKSLFLMSMNVTKVCS